MTDRSISKEKEKLVNPAGSEKTSDDPIILDILVKILNKWRSMAIEEAADATLHAKAEPRNKDLLEETVFIPAPDLKGKTPLGDAKKKIVDTVIEETVIISASTILNEEVSDTVSKKPDLPVEDPSTNNFDQSRTEKEVKTKSEREDFLAETMILKLPDKDKQKGRE